MNTTEAAEKWNCCRDDVAAWCKAGLIVGAVKPAVKWVIPDDAKRPIDRKLQKEIIWRILELSNGSLRRFDLTVWGLSEEDLDGYFAAMTPLLLSVKTTSQNNAPISISDLFVTEAGFELIGRRAQGSKITTPKVLIWTADVAGVFTASFIRGLITGNVEDAANICAANLLKAN